MIQDMSLSCARQLAATGHRPEVRGRGRGRHARWPTQVRPSTDCTEPGHRSGIPACLIARHRCARAAACSDWPPASSAAASAASEAAAGSDMGPVKRSRVARLARACASASPGLEPIMLCRHCSQARR